MADVIKKIRTPDGDLPIDYNALANKPDLDKKLNTSGGTVTGDLTIEGDLRVQGDAVETHLENVKIPQNSLTLRDGASQGLLNHEYTGIIAEKYDGANDGMLVFDKDGTAYVGDRGDVQPLATRAKSTDMPNDEFTKWNSSKQRLEGSGISATTITNMQTDIDGKTKAGQQVLDDTAAYVKNISINSANYAEVHKVGGMTRKCTNIIPFPYIDTTSTINGLTFTVNSDGSVVVNGTATSTAFFRLTNNFVDLTDGETYYISDGVNRNDLYVRAYGDLEARNGSFIYRNGINFYFEIRAQSGVTFSNVIVKPMLNKGATALPYEPYFDGLRDSKVTEIKSVGANLFDEQWKAGYYISSAGVDTESSLNICSANITPVKPNTQYIFTVNANVTINTRAVAFYIDGVFHSRIQSGFSFTTPNGVNGVRFGMDNSDGKAFTASLIESAILNAGSTALPYSPYMENILTIPAAVQALDGWGQGINETVYNHISWRDGGTKKTYNKMVYEFVLDGSTDEVYSINSAYSGTLYNCFTINLGAGKWLKAASVGVCNQCEITTSATILEEDAPYAYFGNVSIGQFFFKLPKATVPDVATLRTYLASNPVIVLYIATPIVTDISDLITSDNLIGVEPHGTLTFENEHKYNVPSMVQFYENTNELIGADEFVGDLTGTAKRAIADKEGRNIEQTYATKAEMNEKLDVSAKKIYSGIKHQEDVPNNVANYASLSRLGGMTRKCTNIIPYPYFETTKTTNGLTFTVNADGSISITGTATVNTALYLVGENSAQRKPIKAGTYTASTTGDPNVEFIIGIAGDKEYNASYYGSKVVITVGSDTTYYAKLRILTGKTVNTTVYPMLNAGSTALPYEPYFKGLRSAKVTEVKSVGVNLIPYPYNFTTITKEGITITAHRDGSFTIDGTSTGFTWTVLSNIKTEVGKQYTGKAYACPLGANMYLYYDDNDALPFSDNAATTTAKQNAYDIVLAVGAGNTYNNVRIYPMLNVGTTAKPYTPYVEHILPIPEAVQALDGYGLGVNESAHNYIDWEKKQFVKRVGKVDMGTLSWAYNALKVFQTNSLGAIGLSAMCSKYEFAGVSQTGNSEAYKFGNRKLSIFEGDRRIYVRDDDYTDVETFKTAISGVMLYYELAEPIITDISDLLSNEVIPVEDNGTLTFVNEFNYDVPYEVNFYDEVDEIVAAKEIIGNLTGTASMAQCDATGRNIADTFDARTKSGRLVIGISGTHTLDDADILFGANEADGVENSAKLKAAIQKGGFGELFFLAGRFYVHGGFSCNGRTIRGSSRNMAGYYGGSSNHATYIVNTEDWGDGGILSGDNCRICDLTITSTDTAYNSEESTRVGFYSDYGENSVLENVTFEKIRGTAIHIYEGYGITVRNCIVKSDCGTGIYCSDGKYVTISDCDVSSSVSIDSNNQTENPVYVFSNKFNGDCTLYNCYAENNLIKGAFSGIDNFTTIGATELTEGKVKALNAVGTKVVYRKKMSTSSFYSPSSGTFKRGNDTLYAVIVKGGTTNFVSTGIMQSSSEKSKTTAYLDIGTVKVDFDEDKVFIDEATHAEVDDITFIRIL